MMNEQTLGQKIAEGRKKLGISQEALGEKMGVSRQAISKWESDGTVPEIDKLIALSRLFSVSVGWLLGVEEHAPPQPDELTESQLKMVEEIVKRYQPQPQKRKFPWGLAAALSAIVLAIVMITLNPSPAPDYSGQISSLQYNYQAIQSELQSLAGRVEDIASAAEAADELLLSYEFQLGDATADGEITSAGEVPDDAEGSVTVVDMPTAALTFTAVPKQHTDSDRAWLVVLLNGRQMQQVECIWQSAGYTADVSLWLADGYEYRFVLEHQDGIQEMQVLNGGNYADIYTNSSFHFFDFGSHAVYNPRSWEFQINCYGRTFKPSIGDSKDAQWSESGLILYRNGNSLERRSDPIDRTIRTAHNEYIYDLSNLTFRNVKLEDGDEVELIFFVTLDDGEYGETSAGRWTFQDGELVELTEE